MAADAVPRPFLTPNPEIAARNGLDAAIISELEGQFAEAYDDSLMDRVELTTAIGVLHETLRGGPLMDYFAFLKAGAAAAMGAFPALDPTKPVEIIAAQQAIGRFDHLIEWMKGYIAVAPGGRLPDSDDPPEDA